MSCFKNICSVVLSMYARTEMHLCKMQNTRSRRDVSSVVV